MKVFARWIKAPLDNHSEEEYYFRKNTILQFGNSWDIIGAAILINPGSALPTDESIDCETISRLQKISDICDKKDEWRAFNADSTILFRNAWRFRIQQKRSLISIAIKSIFPKDYCLSISASNCIFAVGSYLFEFSLPRQ